SCRRGSCRRSRPPVQARRRRWTRPLRPAQPRPGPVRPRWPASCPARSRRPPGPGSSRRQAFPYAASALLPSGKRAILPSRVMDAKDLPTSRMAVDRMRPERGLVRVEDRRSDGVLPSHPYRTTGTRHIPRPARPDCLAAARAQGNHGLPALARKALLPCPQGKEACNGKARSLVRKPRSSDHKAFCFKRKAKSLAREAGELQAHGPELRKSKLGTPTAKLGAPGARQKAPALELLSFEVGTWSLAVGAFGLVRKAR